MADFDEILHDETADDGTRPVRLLVLLAAIVTLKSTLVLTSGDSEVTTSADDIIVISLYDVGYYNSTISIHYDIANCNGSEFSVSPISLSQPNPCHGENFDPGGRTQQNPTQTIFLEEIGLQFYANYVT